MHSGVSTNVDDHNVAVDGHPHHTSHLQAGGSAAGGVEESLPCQFRLGADLTISFLRPRHCAPDHHLRTTANITINLFDMESPFARSNDKLASACSRTIR